MAITVKHTKVSLIPDGDDASVVRPSDWNADHQLVGLGTIAEQDANSVAITGGTISGVTLPASNITGTLGVPNGGTGATTLTGYVKGSGTSALTASSTIPNTDITGLGTASTKDVGIALGVATLDASGKVPTSQIPLQGDLNYQGTWNATTNTPTLTSSVGTQGYYYVVDVAGTTNLNGITDWKVGDWAIYNGTVWQKVDNTDAVTSVNGQVGTVVLTTTNIAEGTNEYFTTARARASISAGTGISYDNSTGVVTNSAPDQTVSLTAGTGISTSGTYPNFTITNTAPSLGGNVVGPASATDNAIARYDTTTGKLIQNSTVTITDNGDIANANSVDFDITPATLPTAQGTLYWDNADSIQTLSLVMEGGNAVQQIGEETYFRIKCSAAITKGQVVMFTGTVGSSGGLTGAPATGLTVATASYVMGVANESGALNDWIYVTAFGLVRGINTTGGAEAWVDGQILYYDPTVTGGLTKTLPAAPNAKVQVCAVVNADNNGSLFIRPAFGGALGQYEGDVQVTTPSNGQLLIRDQTSGKWVNAALTAGTAISVTNTAGAVSIANTGVTSAVAGTGISVSGATGAVTVTNTAPDKVVSITGAGTTSVTGTYPNFTVTSNDQYVGTVTSVAALTIGTSGTDLSSTVANSTTTPVISLQVPTASATNRGALSASDWSTFNGKANAFTYTTNYVPYGQGTTTPNQSAKYTFDGTTQTAPIQRASNGIVVNSKTVSASYSIASGDCGMSVGPVTVASGQSVTVASGSRWVVL